VLRTHKDEVTAAQSVVLNDNQLPSKKVYIFKPPHRNKKCIFQRKKKKSSFKNAAAHDTFGLPDRAHHIQVYSAAGASADKIAINETLSSALQRKK
jgi:hypothetical protein